MGSLVSGYYGAKCGDCPFQSECVGGTGKESSLAMALKQNAKRMAAKMQTPEAKEKYKKRKETVEWPLGNIKQNMKFTEFLTRGIEKVPTEFTQTCINHNIQQIWTHLKKTTTPLNKIKKLLTNITPKNNNVYTQSSKHTHQKSQKNNDLKAI